MPDPIIGELGGGVVATIATSLATLAAGVWKYLDVREKARLEREKNEKEERIAEIEVKAAEKAARRSDNAAERDDQYDDYVHKRLRELEERCDTFAEQRNQALSIASAADAKVARLEERVAHLEAQRAAAEKMIEKVQEKYDTLVKENEGLRAEIKLLERMKPVDTTTAIVRPEMLIPGRRAEDKIGAQNEP